MDRTPVFAYGERALRMLVAVACLGALALGVGGCRRTQVPQAPVLNGNAPNAIPGHYLVIFKDGSSSESIEAAKALARGLGATVRFTYTAALKGFSAELPPPALAAVRALPDVAYLEADKRHEYQTSLSQPPTPATPPDTGLDRIDRRLPPLNQTYTYSETGAGVHVYVIDSGIRVSHSEFGGRATADFTVATNHDDCRGHGTHVAAIIGGQTSGVAKGVRIHAVKVGELLDCGPTEASIIKGIDWVTANRMLPAVANVSVGGPPVSTAMDIAVAASIATGVTYVIAAANYGESACNSSPGRVPAAITVAAVDPQTDRHWVSSNIGSCVDLFAPGVDIRSASRADDTATETRSGTSQAAPFVAGAAARFLETSPMATPVQVWTAIHRTNNVSTTAGWSGVGDRGNASPNEQLYVHDANSLTVPSSDPTPPDAISLEIERPNGSRLRASKDTADPSARAMPGQTIRLTSSGSDPDGGLRDIQIWMTEQIWNNGVTVGPGLAGAPVASDPKPVSVGQPARIIGSVSWSFTFPAMPAGQLRQYVFWARAENYHSGALQSHALTIDLP
jgi:subtilisin family serine protease